MPHDVNGTDELTRCLHIFFRQAVYDDGLGRCLSRDEKIDGDGWDLLCKQAGQNGYYAITADGDIDLSSQKEYRKDVFGHCLK
ncbi:hypothetical protein E4U60_003428 [Claviceps pazoutovae]|uniref:Uncharacterized protein n=1 Tax=Claviceps pazoutovae TaxID=1649127 RepID=A0A9P7MA23_9HYPO|nr:hypothetical protein E4U60_003428 [Claviceps pazoutovae]